jgi:hypothetical protein
VAIPRFDDTANLGITLLRCSNGRTYILEYRGNSNEVHVSDRVLLINEHKVDGREPEEVAHFFLSRQNASSGADAPDHSVHIRLAPPRAGNGAARNVSRPERAASIVQCVRVRTASARASVWAIVWSVDPPSRVQSARDLGEYRELRGGA